MADKQLFYFVLAFFVLAVLLVGYVGGDCVRECEQAGTSSARCFQICRP